MRFEDRVHRSNADGKIGSYIKEWRAFYEVTEAPPSTWIACW